MGERVTINDRALNAVAVLMWFTAAVGTFGLGVAVIAGAGFSVAVLLRNA